MYLPSQLTFLNKYILPHYPGSSEGPSDQRGGHQRDHPLCGGAPGGPGRESEPRGAAQPPGCVDQAKGAVQRPEGFSHRDAVRGGHGHQYHRTAEHAKGEQLSVQRLFIVYA